MKNINKNILKKIKKYKKKYNISFRKISIVTKINPFTLKNLFNKKIDKTSINLNDLYNKIKSIAEKKKCICFILKILY